MGVTNFLLPKLEIDKNNEHSIVRNPRTKYRMDYINQYLKAGR